MHRIDFARSFLEANRMAWLCHDHRLHADIYFHDRLLSLERLRAVCTPGSIGSHAPAQISFFTFRIQSRPASENSGPAK